MRTLIHLFVIAFICALLSGCGSPFATIGQKKVEVVERVTQDQREAEAVATDYLARTITQPPEAKSVAQTLAKSVGAPSAPSDDWQQIVADLQAEIAALNARQQELLDWHNRYAGKPLEGTGWSIGSLFSSWWVWGAAALAITALGGGPILLLGFRTLRGTIRAVVAVVDGYAKDFPDAADELRDRLSKAMDSSHKKVIRAQRAHAS